MSDRVAICEMFPTDIKAEINARHFELLDPSLDSAYRRWVCDRIEALRCELALRDITNL